MKDPKDKKIDKPLRLPQISAKTASSFSTDTTSHSRVRPSSSSKLNDLEKNLFAQLDQYEDFDRKTKKSRTRKQIELGSVKEGGPEWLDIDAPYLKKLEKILPDTYAKLLDTKKSQPLHQNNKAKPRPPNTAEQGEKKPSAEPVREKKARQKQQKRETRQKQQKRESSFIVAEREVEEIFQQYLREEGLEFKPVQSADLKEINDQLDAAQADISSLRKNMYDLIRQFGNECVRDQ